MVQGCELAAVRCACCEHVQSSERADCRLCGAALEQVHLALQVAAAGCTRTHAGETVAGFAALAPAGSPLEAMLWRQRQRWRAHAWVGAGVLTGATLLLGLPYSLTPVGLVRGLSLGVCLGAPLGYLFSRSSTM